MCSHVCPHTHATVCVLIYVSSYTGCYMCVLICVLISYAGYSYTSYERVLKCNVCSNVMYVGIRRLLQTCCSKMCPRTQATINVCIYIYIYICPYTQAKVVISDFNICVLICRLLPVCAHVCSHTQAKVVISDLVLGRPTAKANRKLAAISGRLKREL